MNLRLDIRTKILLLLLANVFMFKKMSIYEHLILATIFSLIVFIFFNQYRALRIYAIYLLFTLYELFLAKVGSLGFIDNLVLFSSLLFKTVYFPICAGMVLVGSSKVSELITFLRKIKLSNSVIIVLAVVFRFFPVMLADYSMIKNSLKIKGVGNSPFYYFRHPLKFMEYVFVPYVIISTNIANELSISCLCRGIEHKGKASSIQVLKFKITDYLFMIFLVKLVVFVFIFKI
ncbi:energy-coupling factor transporter transmembrane protein EcfT [Gemella sp. zg-1178]|uniref:energy-coupling factor transporter transmembrane component T family protein n=1 Tax=Gemella sp. zg-1178 TaxID=2840372 RepID=UPI001C05A2B4|nr:energy-coupling factor transporter transmembrane component T [Gemella sp. zg-1178]MBU0278577.1 energy-coupling factor transporter transmembrane protein EcfT [Gemella sp. zg-1178]